MKIPQLLFAILAIVPVLMVLNAAARAQAPENETDSLYLGKRVVLTVSAPRQITINAPIRDFAWSPDGRKIAYFTAGNPPSGDTAIVVAYPSGGRPRVYYRAHMGPIDSDPDHTDAYIEQFVGWSPDGNYLAFVIDSDNAEGKSESLLDVLEMAKGLVRQAPVPFPANNEHRVFSIHDATWSPQRDRIAYTASVSGGKEYALVYDAAQDVTHSLVPSGENAGFLGWLDSDHARVWTHADGLTSHLAVDAATGASAATKARGVIPPPNYASCRLNAGSVGIVRLTLLSDPNQNLIESVKDSTGKVHGSAVHLWLSVTQDRSPDAPAMSGASKPPAPPVVLVDTYRYSPYDGELKVQLAPQRRDLPDRAQVAYLISGDLYVADIAVRSPSVQELIAAGEKLTCPEEQLLAASDAKQLGLAVIQYCQDYDAHYPMADDFHDEVYPYTKSEQVFQVDGHEFQFVLDGDAMKDLDHPESVEMGDFDLPCGRIVLYADGHVQALVKAGKPIAP